jgi:hypothetical protein
LDRSGLDRAGLIRAGVICARLIQARHRRSTDRRRLFVCGRGRALREGSSQRLWRLRYIWKAWHWRTRRPPHFGSNFGSDLAPSFEHGATHSAKTEIVRIVLTALRADHEWLSECLWLQFNSWWAM